MRNPTALTRTFEALGAPDRRQLLFALLEEDPQGDDTPGPLARQSDGLVSVDADASRIDLFHVHLPKLQDLGYVAWERGTGRVGRGPNWAEVVPVLELLRDHRGELPGDLF